MAGMTQQFELNRQFMENIMAQFPRPNMNEQPTQVTLQDFMRLNATVYCSSTQPLDSDDWLHDITYEMESADVAPELCHLCFLLPERIRGSMVGQPQAYSASWNNHHLARLPSCFPCPLHSSGSHGPEEA